MIYSKPPFTYEQQADLLMSRGMRGDKSKMIERLKVVNYYRLSGYWYPFRLHDPTNPKNRLDEFEEDTCFEVIWKRYVFDRHLRLLVMDALERIEIALRTQMSYHHAHKYGNGFDYAINPSTMSNANTKTLSEFNKKLVNEKVRSHEAFVKHFLAKYGEDHKYLPVWMASEIMSFGTVLHFYKAVENSIQSKVAMTFASQREVFKSWLLSLNTIRNICAHHGRLWNRELGLKPKIPKNDPNWNIPVVVPNNRIFGILTILKHCINEIAPQSHWPERLKALLIDYHEIPLERMGFPENWELCPIWNS